MQLVILRASHILILLFFMTAIPVAHADDPWAAVEKSRNQDISAGAQNSVDALTAAYFQHPEDAGRVLQHLGDLAAHYGRSGGERRTAPWPAEDAQTIAKLGAFFDKILASSSSSKSAGRQTNTFEAIMAASKGLVELRAKATHLGLILSARDWVNAQPSAGWKDETLRQLADAEDALQNVRKKTGTSPSPQASYVSTASAGSFLSFGGIERAAQQYKAAPKHESPFQVPGTRKTPHDSSWFSGPSAH